MVDPAPRAQDAVGVDVVRLPERAPVGRHRGAADVRLVPRDPRQDDGSARSECDDSEQEHRPPATGPGEQERHEDERQQRHAHVPEDREPADDAEPDRGDGLAPLHEPEQQEHGRSRERLVEDLPVHVDVVPDDVGLQRREGCSDEPLDPPEQALADPEDEHSRQRRDRDVREPDDHPAPLERPVERDQEEAVERLRVRGRVARHEAVRPARDERPRERVALVEEARRDLPALVEEHREAHDDGERGDGGDRVPAEEAAHHAATVSRAAAALAGGWGEST